VLRMLVEKNIDLDLSELCSTAVANYGNAIADPSQELMVFCLERLKGWYLDRGVSNNVFMAVAANKITNPLDFDRRVNAVTEFSTLPAAQSLAAANKRVANILAKEKVATGTAVEVARLDTKEEQDLYATIENKEAEISPLLYNANYSAILQSLSTLQAPVDNFFNHVMVMVEDPTLRNNRLNLLQRLRNLFLEVADVSLL
jgi:glycyl-tRNA synthetase beta chain